MRAAVVAGIVLIVAGALALTYQGFSYTKEEKVLDVGPISATAETRERISIPPVVGGLAIAAGVVLLLAGRRNRS